ncbi:MAG: glycoside-pentoside-hexuronide (GPH):cation symporter [Clostridiales bacterium]|nr:glycoside-pentoside-hexuronide (GPH):cation symporter [Clostridiales bacterium]
MPAENKLGVKNYFGYLVCDVANGLAFCVMSSYLSVYCSDILGISGGVISAIMIIARIWDGINDPIMGFLVQSKKPGKYGKYRPFILWGGYPLAISAVLVFARFTDNLTFNTIWVAVLYMVYGMLYTVVLVPYGSLASVMTTKDSERSVLSMCRSVGGGIGNLPTILFPIFVMTAGENSSQMDSGRLIIGMVIIAAAMAVLYTISFSFTRERIVVNDKAQKINFFSTLSSLIKNKAFVTMSIIGALVIAAQMYTSTVNLYLFKDYFENSAMNTVYTVISYTPMVLMIPFANTLIKKFGKKEICVAGLAVSAVSSLAVYLLHFSKADIYLFIAMAFLINCGVAFITLEIWSMAADIIDHQEWVSGRREEAANYAIFTFMRKIGQAIAALAPWFVSLAGYDSDKVGSGISQGETVLNGMYNIATLVPFIMYVIMLVLMAIYPLNKKTTDKMHAELDARRSEYKVEVV